jgi:hypothetical protein
VSPPVVDGHESIGQPEGRGAGGALIWVAGLVVVVAAGAATAHGLYEVALASRAPAGIAWLYPLITDGLALVAYAATTRVAGSGRRYAWAVVVLAAGLSGLAQATYLAGGVAAASAGLRFGVGAWPAVAAAIAAHLLFLIGAYRPTGVVGGSLDGMDVDTGGPTVDGHRVSNHGVHPVSAPAVQQALCATGSLAAPDREPGVRRALSPRDRARTVAELRHRESGALPTVRELAQLAEVSRGTAANALETLRQPSTGLHVITNPHEEDTQL